ncbi:MAG TPA: polysaccharide biosynthesis C-terminal domain-containing protein [Bacteroidales bacterium]|nr:polysaccharide biosynthesis C-terminal domain-containing protein [Bacteroidales bacterium]HPT08928.1 polysaccharide biosynthesis C-terminal domain-containing protein [Bacteroidales bacterium]
MFKKVIGTIGTRLVNALLAFIAASLNAHCLGAEKVGTIYLLIFSVTIIQLFNNFVSGGALVYMTPRTGTFRLFVPATIWTLVMTGILTAFLHLLGQWSPTLDIIPEGYLWPVLFLAFAISLCSVNFMLLLGHEKVKAYNIINLVQITTLFLILLLFLFVFEKRTVMAYFWAIFLSYVVAYVISLAILIPMLKPEPMGGIKQLMKEILRFGTFVQVANIFQQLNYRLSLKFVDAFQGRAAVGVLSIGMTLAEGLWLVSRSISMVQFSRLSNEKDDQYAAHITLSFAKVTWIITLAGMGILLLIPVSVYTFVFGEQFVQVRNVIASLSVGIVALSVSMIFSSYFSGINKPFHNTISSAIGLVFTVGLGFLLVPLWGIIGAGIAATCSYTMATLYQFIIFIRMTKLTPRDFLLTREELQLVMTEIRNIKTNATSR